MQVCMYVCMYEYRNAKNFPKIHKTPQNSRCQEDDINQVPFCGSTNTRHHHTKFSYHSNLAPSNCAHLYECNLCAISCSWNQHITVCGCESTVLCFFLLTQQCVDLIINSHALINYQMLRFQEPLCCEKNSGFWRTLWILRSMKYMGQIMLTWN